MSMPTLRIIEGDNRETLKTMEAESVDCCVTSPPYWGLRDYGVDGQIGLEDSLGEWLDKMVEIFAEVRRVLRDDGTCWVNMGDCYNTSGRKTAGAGQYWERAASTQRSAKVKQRSRMLSLKNKDLVGQPWRLALALQEDGWWLRRDIIWHKPNPMPETVYDRPTTAHEYIFLLTKSSKYFYNWEEAREPVTGNSHSRGDGVNKKVKAPDGWDQAAGAHGTIHREGRAKGKTRPKQNASFSAAVSGVSEDETRNWRSVWKISTEKFGGAHFATFPQELPRRCIIAGCPMGGTVLDPFGGSGTTGQVALELGRSAVLCELNPEYVALIKQRCAITPDLHLT